VLLDAGNALFRAPGSNAPAELERARFILKASGAMGTKALAVGQKDLLGGVPFLVDEAKKAQVPLVSTSLRAKDTGKPLFPTSLVFTHEGVKVALLATSGLGDVPGVPNVTSLNAIEALSAELPKLPARDLTVVVATGGYLEAMAIAEQLSGKVDLVVQSGEYRGSAPPQRVRDAFVLASGDRGRALAVLTLGLAGKKGVFTDLNEASRDEELLANLDRQLTSIDERMSKATDVESKKALASLRNDMKARRDEQAKKVKQLVSGRTLKLDWYMLGPDVPDDEALKKETLAIEPSYAGSH
jgi:2',3'-cyclic-nucleotide 2'-phosphodiesterase (5'-nucleotidase family)